MNHGDTILVTKRRKIFTEWSCENFLIKLEV